MKTYNYLGLTISANGKFKEGLKNLKRKAQKALFSLKAKLGSIPNLSITLSSSLFDKLIRPILTYGCDVWGDEFSKKSPVEDVNVGFCRYILGVSQKTPIMGLYSELGRYPLDVFIKQQSIRFYNRIQNSSNILLKEASSVNKDLKSKWFHEMTSLLNRIKQYSVINMHSKITATQLIKINSGIKQLFSSNWKIEIDNDKRGDSNEKNKLRKYRIIKSGIELEPYLIKFHNIDLRTSLVKFRLSDHNLKIETGRHNRIPLNNRICDMCNQGRIEDEFHFLMECSSYTNMHNILHDVAKNRINAFYRHSKERTIQCSP